MATSLKLVTERMDGPPIVQRAVPRLPPLVLVVEDHEDTRFMLTYLLEIWGCRVATAQDGKTAISVAEQLCPDLILMDASLPRLDGLEATRRIRAHAALAHVPIVFLSGHAQPAFRVRALETGGNDFLVKPFALRQLEQLLEKHLSSNGALKADQARKEFL